MFLKYSALVIGISLLVASNQALSEQIDKKTGLVVDTGLKQVVMHCSSCHSTKLIAQNRMSRETWLETIRWMQKSQGLWPLGPAETVILDYLETNYAPVSAGRRSPIPAHLMPQPKRLKTI